MRHEAPRIGFSAYPNAGDGRLARRTLRLVGSAALVSALAGGSGAIGCRSAVDDFYTPLASGTATGGSGGTGGLPSDCTGDPTKDPSLVRDECGLFVDLSAGSSGKGTKASPFKTLGEAAEKSASRIFVCARDEAYVEPATVVLTNGVEVFGGFGDCPAAGDWTWDAAKRAKVNGPANAPVFHVSMGESLIQGFALTAPNATDPGASSIGILADSAVLKLTDVDVATGDGAIGANGAVPQVDALAGKDAAPDATPACNPTQVPGKGASQTCDDGDSTGGDGGKGGLSGVMSGEAGTNGEPLPDPNPDGFGTGGQPTEVSITCDGKPGKEGDAGGSGAGGEALGTLTLAGVTGGDGEDGGNGKRGQGGGGGGGAKAGTFCPPAGTPTPGPGASGGGGGSGGCGGKGGGGGKAGGSSVGIVSLASTLTFSGVTITTGAGATGGNGALGKSGGDPGNGAAGGAKSGIGTSKPGCAGGKGGNGGNGGQGGGGRGGHSIGIAYTVTAPVLEGATITPGTAGNGGVGDSLSMGDGALGTAGEAVKFD